MKANKSNLKNVILNTIYPLIALALVLAIWAIVAEVKNKPLILPKPDVTLKNFFMLFASKAFWVSAGYSLLRTIICFLIAFALAFVLGAIGGMLPVFAKIFAPIVSVLRAVPTLAVILIAMIWLDADGTPILIGFLVAFPILYQSVYTAIVGVDRDLVEMTKVYNVSVVDRVLHLYMPEIAPSIFDSSRSTVSLTLKVVIAAEVLAYTRDSIGHQMQTANLTYDISLLLAWTIMAIVLSFLLEGVVFGLKKLWEVKK